MTRWFESTIRFEDRMVRMDGYVEKNSGTNLRIDLGSLELRDSNTTTPPYNYIYCLFSTRDPSTMTLALNGTCPQKYFICN